MKRLMVAIAGAALVAGCSTVSISKTGTLKGIDVKGADGKADRTLCVGNEGYFFFNWVPIVSSSMDWDDEENGIDLWSMSWFKDETTVQRLTDAFYRYAERENCDVVNVVVDDKTCYGISYGIADLFDTHEIFITGVLKPRK